MSEDATTPGGEGREYEGLSYEWILCGTSSLRPLAPEWEEEWDKLGIILEEARDKFRSKEEDEDD